MPDILIVSADWRSRALLAAQLREEGLEPHPVEDIPDALRLIESGACWPEVVFIDLPDAAIDREQIAALHERAGQVPLLFCLPVSGTPAALETFREVIRITRRPVSIGEIAEKIRQLLDKRPVFLYNQGRWDQRKAQRASGSMSGKVRFAGLSNVGKVRSSNEDALGIFPELSLFVVADGMGGHAGGEVASRMAVELVHSTFQQELQSMPSLAGPERLKRAIQAANLKIHEAGRKDASLSGMGTTLVSALLEGETAHIAYVGDSRAYLFREGKVSLLTHDHSLVNEYLKLGLMSQEEAERHPLKHVLSRALGTGTQVEVEILPLRLKPGDVLLLCTDGLSNTVPDSLMAEGLSQANADLEEACQRLVDLANRRGGFDNITVVLVQYANTNV